MGKRAINDTYTNAVITNEDGVYWLTEIKKDEEKRYNLTKILDELLNVDDLTFVLKSNVELEPSE